MEPDPSGSVQPPVGDRPNGAIGAGRSGAGRKLVVCCIGGAPTALQPAFEMLAPKGFEIVALEGADVQPVALGEHARRHGVDALYVLATLAESPSPELAALESALRAADVPSHHVIALTVDWRDPMALVEQVAAFERTSSAPPPVTSAPVLRTNTTSPPAGRRDSTGPQRAITLVSPRSETGSQRVVPPPPATGPHTVVSTRPATGPQVLPSQVPTGPQTVVASGPPTGRLPSQISTGPQTVVASGPPPLDEDPPTVIVSKPASAVQPSAMRPDESPEIERNAPPTRHDSNVKRRMLSVQVPAVPLADAHDSDADPVVTRFPAPLAPPLPPVDAPPLPSIGLGPEPMAPTTSEPIQRDAMRTVTAELEAPSDATGSRTKLLAVGGALAVAVVFVAWLALRGGGEPASETTAVDPATVAKGSSESTPVSSDAATPDAVTNVAAVELARSRGELAIHEGIVFAPKRSPKKNFAGAQKLCVDMNAGALKGWRLPTLAELHVLALAGVIDRGVYWSGTDADEFGDRALVWSEKKTTAAPITKAWKGARALCVRDDPPAK